MNLVINLLIYLSILRLIYYPFFGPQSVIASAIASILLSVILATNFQIDKSKLIIIFYSLLLFVLNLFSPIGSLNDKFIGFFETVTPFLVLGSVSSSKFLNYLRNNINFFKNSLIFLILILLTGHLIEFLGVPLPKITETPLTTELGKQFLLTNRIASFVGGSGPYSLSLTYLLISLQILNPKSFFWIFLLGLTALFFSFSRLGLFIFLIFNFTIFIIEFFKSINFKNGLINKSKLYNLVVFSFLILLGIQFEFGEQIIVLFNRTVDGLSFEDQGNIDRLQRFLYLVTDFKQDNIMNILIGDGTGITARATGAPQGESQIGKIFVEWGFLGISLIIVWLLELVGILKFKFDQILIKINSSKLALFVTIFANLFFIQAFTSSPIFVSMVFPLIAINYQEILK